MQYCVNFKQTEFKDENFHPKVTQPADIRHRLCVENRLAVEKNGVFCQTLYISAVSLLEIALKNNVVKLELNFAIEDIPMYCQQIDFDLIPLTPFEALGFLTDIAAN